MVDMASAPRFRFQNDEIHVSAHLDEVIEQTKLPGAIVYQVLYLTLKRDLVYNV